MQSKCIEQWHKAVANSDPSLLSELLSDDVVFHSPVVHTPQLGKAITLKYLSAAVEVLVNKSFQYTAEMSNSRRVTLEFQVELEGTVVNGVDMISWNEDEKITEFKVMVRPLKAMGVVQKLMAERLTRGAS
jgi:hypothetical protein